MSTPTPSDLHIFAFQPGDKLPKPNRRPRQPRPKPADRFMAGPVCWDWLTTTANLPGKALHVALVIQFLAGLNRSATVSLSSDELSRLGVARTTGYRALAALESAGLVKVSRHQGRSPVVTTCEAGMRRTSPAVQTVTSSNAPKSISPTRPDSGGDL